MTKANDEILGYGVEAEQLQALRNIMTTLYSDTALTDDSRRDLANRMHAIIGQIESVPLYDDALRPTDNSQ